MVKLIVAVGFLAVFGFVAYSLVLLLTRQFNKLEKGEKQNDESNNELNNNNPKTQNEQDGK